MIIQAKFKSVCPNCQKEIEAGSKVEWKQGQKAIHEECYNKKLEEEKSRELEEWENKKIRYGDRIEVTEDIWYQGLFENKESELIAPKGVKGKIYTTETIKRKINDKLYECVHVEEIVRKGKHPKSKTGYFIVPFEMMIITKKARL